MSAVDAESEFKERMENNGREKRQPLMGLTFLPIVFANSEVRLGDKSLNVYLHSALQITKPFHIPHLFELCDNNKAIRA